DPARRRRGGGGLYQRRPGPSDHYRSCVQRREHAAVGAAGSGDADGLYEPHERRFRGQR
ncbi:type VI secretion system tip protein VgrG, partial [Enterobacter bugandensis]